MNAMHDNSNKNSENNGDDDDNDKKDKGNGELFGIGSYVCGNWVNQKVQFGWKIKYCLSD